jgi:hypothetical protein
MSKPGTRPPLPASRVRVPVELIERRIYLIRGEKVMLDGDLAELYRVPTRTLNQAVRRHGDRFPEDFMFQLTQREASSLRSQIVILEKGRGRYSKYVPLAFTEHGVAMLSSVLNSKAAVQMNIRIIRAFVKLRELLATHKDLARKIEQLEGRQKQHTSIITVVVDEIKKLKRGPPSTRKKRPIGFVTD